MNDASSELDAAEAPPVLAIYAMALAPYEVHLYRRIADELPLRLKTFVAYGDGSREWSFSGVESIGLEDLSEGDRLPRLSRIGAQVKEWRRAGTLIQRLKASDARAVILAGYNDVGRLRVAAWCRRHGIPLFLRSDSNAADEQGKSWLKSHLKKALLSRLGRYLTAHLVVGPRGVDYWRHYTGDGVPTVLCPYEPDYTMVESVTPDEARAAALRLGLDLQRRRLVFSGRLIPVKRVDLLIDAFASIADERPGWDLLILGDGDLRDALQTRLPGRLSERVTWTGFLSDMVEVARLYHACDVLVLPSEREPWALVVNEAAAAGLAIVTSDIVGASPALVHEGVNGETFLSGDVGGLTEALLRVTEPTAIDRYKSASPDVLSAWRRDHDPVEGLRSALVRSGVLDAD